MCSKNSKVTGIYLTFSMGLMLLFSPGVFAGEIIGWIENVGISPDNNIVTAKIDTGADSSSLHCNCVDKFIRNGESWVRFTITDIEGEKVSVEKKVINTVKIKRHQNASQQRSVVRLGLCIGNHYKESDVSLVDRSGYGYKMLIGRNYLAGTFIVDPSRKLTTSPQCSESK